MRGLAFRVTSVGSEDHAMLTVQTGEGVIATSPEAALVLI
jgi:hypothetical protein